MFYLETLLLVVLVFVIFKRCSLLTKLLALYMVFTFVLGRLLIPYSQILVVSESVQWSVVLPYVVNIFFLGTLSSFIGMIASAKNVCVNSKIYIKIRDKYFIILLIAYAIFASCLVLYTMYKIGVIPLLSENPLVAKYFSDSIDIYRQYRPLYNLGIAILSFTSTISILMVFDYGRRFRRIIKYLLVLFFSIAILFLTMKRGPLLKPFLILMGGCLLLRRFTLTRFFIYCGILLMFGVLLWFVRGLSLSISLQDFCYEFLYGLSNNIFVEIRELCRVCSSITISSFQPIWGKTFFAGFLSIIPTKFFPLKKEFYLGRYTLNILGLDPDVAGAPRISMFGEAYLNFGILGVVIVSFFYGVFVQIFSNFVEKRVLGGVTVFGILFMLFLTLFFGFYTSGSPSFQITEINLFLLFLFSILGFKIKILKIERKYNEHFIIKSPIFARKRKVFTRTAQSSHY